MTGNPLNDQQAGGPHDGGPLPVPLHVIAVVAAFAGGTGIMSLVAFVQLVRHGDTLAAWLLAVVFAVFAVLGLIVGVGVPVQQFCLRRALAARRRVYGTDCGTGNSTEV
jgi:uncharacterized membrane protein YciS (DUF1049 family)